LDSSDEEFKLHLLDWKHKFEENVKSSFEDEVADVAIRLFDLCGGLKIDLEKHIELKMKYNSLRGYKHGKKF
jgi:NTP pyrophosphatase (non-canonical NTP hydrolase)